MKKPTPEPKKLVELVPAPPAPLGAAEAHKVADDLAAAKKERATAMREQQMAQDGGDLTESARLTGVVKDLNRAVQRLTDTLGVAQPAGKSKKLEEQVPARHMPTSSMKLGDVMKLSAAGQLTEAGAKAMKALEATEPTQRQVVTAWVPPQMPKVSDVHSVAAYFQGLQTLTPLAPVQRCQKDPFFKPKGGLTNFCTTCPTQNFVPQDGLWLTLLQQVPLKYGAERSALIYDAAREAAQSHYVGSGPLIGWYARLHEGKSAPAPYWEVTEEMKTEVNRLLPWDRERVPDFNKATLEELLQDVQINPAATSGFPYQKKKGTVIPELLKDAIEYFELMRSRKFAQYIAMHPGEFMAIAKNKLDRYEQKDWGHKIRVYYAINGALGIIYSCVVQAYSK